MSQSQTISAYFREDHARLDEAFRLFQRCKGTEAGRARAAFEDFCAGLKRHIAWEEELLFPLWEAKTGMVDGGPTAVMRVEHRQITARLDAIAASVAAGRADSEQDEQALVAVLGMHNIKEERVLYPSIDNVITDAERDDVFRAMQSSGHRA